MASAMLVIKPASCLRQVCSSSNEKGLSCMSHVSSANSMLILPSRLNRRRVQAVSITRAVATEPLTTTKEVDVDSTSKGWTPSSWKNFVAYQQPEYPDAAVVEEVFGQLSDSPPLVFAGEARQLEEKLGAAALGKAFLLQVHNQKSVL